MAESVEVLVVGAGLIGLATARELHQRGRRVVVVEAERAGQGASWAGAGMLGLGEIPAAAPLRALAAASAALYPEFARAVSAETGLSLDYATTGTLALAGSVPAATLSAATPRLPPAELSRLEPSLSPAAAAGGGVYLPDHRLDNRQLVAALLAAARRHGVPVLEHCRVEALARDGEGFRARAGAVELRARNLIITAGAWASALHPRLAPVRPRKGQLIALRAGLGLTHTLLSKDVYLVPRGDGRVIVGSTLEDVGFDARLDPAVAARLRAAAERLVPVLRAAELIEHWCGFRPGTSDDLPIIGRLEAGLWVGVGHFRDGILLTPITAEVLADAVTGRTPRLDLAPFRPERFAPRASALPA